MNGFEYYKLAFKKYAEFTGRSRRRAFWYFTLFNMLVSYAIAGLAYFLLNAAFLSYIYTLIAFIPGLAVTVRRLHDIGKSGWWILIGIIPIIGWIIMIVWAATDSQPGTNAWGPDPKQVGDDISDHLIKDDHLV